MDEATHRFWDIVISAIAPFVTVAGVLVGVWQFQQGEINARALELQKVQLADQSSARKARIEALAALTAAAGQIAASAGDAAALREAAQRYEALYWGSMNLGSDPALERAMINFHNEIRDVQAGDSSADRLRVRSYELVGAARAMTARLESIDTDHPAAQ